MGKNIILQVPTYSNALLFIFIGIKMLLLKLLHY